jgi:hypothetical protein
VAIFVAPRSRAKFFRYWLPVGLWLIIVGLTSSASAAGSRTLALLQWLVATFHLPLSFAQVVEINFLLRKTGHFCNYGIISLLILRWGPCHLDCRVDGIGSDCDAGDRQRG